MGGLPLLIAWGFFWGGGGLFIPRSPPKLPLKGPSTAALGAEVSLEAGGGGDGGEGEL